MEIIDSQEIIFNYLHKSIKKNKVSHAYLINSNDNKNTINIVNKIAMLLSNNGNNNKINENEMKLNIKFIDAKNNTIGKEEILNIEKEFIKKSINNKKMIYIINNCDKMTLNSSNTLLKFLEEPPENVIAILISNNISKVLETIKSRCQLLKLRKNNETNNLNEIELFYKLFPLLNNRENLEIDNISIIVNNTLYFFKYIISNSQKDNMIYGRAFIEEIMNSDELLLSIREKFEIILNIIMNFLYDLLKFRYLGIEHTLFKFKTDFIESISNIVSEKEIEKKLLIIINNIEKNKYNLNTNLFIDNLIMELGG